MTAHKIPGAGVDDGTLGLQADLTDISPSQAVNSLGSFALSGAFSGEQSTRTGEKK